MKLIMENWRKFLIEQSQMDMITGPYGESPGGYDALNSFKDDPPVSQSEDPKKIETGPEGQTRFFEFEKLKGYRIWHQIENSKLEEKVKSFLTKCIDNGLDNPYVIAGSIGTIFKESGFKPIAEKGEGKSGNLMNSSRGINPRIRTII